MSTSSDFIYGSVCSGIEAVTVAWEPLGWKAAWYSEIEAFPNTVLSVHYPNTPNLGDMTKLYANREFRASRIDLLAGGTPCQSFSVAGLRGGLDDPRGNLMLEFLRLAEAKQPRWLVWENVPGVLSSGHGRDFGSFLGALAKLGYGFAYRILDAQFFGVPQRRRRVFVVGYLGDWRPAAAVLFESQSMCRNSSSGRKKRKGTAAATEGSTVGCLQARDYKGVGSQFVAEGKDLPFRTFDRQSSGEYGTDTVASTVSARDYKSAADLVCVTGVKTHALRADGFDASEDGTGRGTPIVIEQNNVSSTPNLPSCRTHKTPNYAIAFHENQRAEVSLNETLGALKNRGGKPGQGYPAILETVGFSGELTADDNKIGPLDAGSRSGGGQPSMVLQSRMQVRRLTPKECERLQGFPDDYTRVPVGKKMAADGPRYKAIGNSMAVPVMRWIGRRIQKVERILNDRRTSNSFTK
jgi:DNA (cytosine-5)-methyltransferase 1